jgi:hypothetical protein
MKKVLSLFALCAMFAFAGCCCKKRDEPRPVKRECVKKEKKCKTCHAKPCRCKNKRSYRNDK